MFKNALYYREERESYLATVLSSVELSGKEKAIWEKRVGRKFPALFLLTLSENPFYPEGGGQAPDRGTVDGEEVLFVKEREAGQQEEIEILIGKDFPVGREVLCKVDFAFRRQQSENHSGEHLLAGLIHSRFGYNNVGFHMELSGENPHVTVDFNGGLSEQEIEELEREVNAVIRRNIPAEERYLEEEKEKEEKGEEEEGERKEEPEFRQKKALSGAVRVISFPGVDSCACCGTHVKRTGEIGIFKVLSHEKHREGTRLFLLSGELAFLDMEKKEKVLLSVSQSLSTDYASLSVRIDKLKAQGEEEKQRRIRLALSAAETLGRAYRREHGSILGSPLESASLWFYGRQDLVFFHFPDYEMILLNKVCEHLKRYVHTDFFCFSSRTEEEWQFAGTGTDCFLERFAAWKQAGKLSGGGKEEMVQGRFQGTAAMLNQWIEEKG
jgi:alanyl-tRNA synthetase (fragment)